MVDVFVKAGTNAQSCTCCGALEQRAKPSHFKGIARKEIEIDPGANSSWDKYSDVVDVVCLGS